MNDTKMICASVNCGREAQHVSKSGLLLCGRCFEETDLALPYVTWRARWRAWRLSRGLLLAVVLVAALVSLTGCDTTTGHYAPTQIQFDVCTVQVRTGMAKDRQACYASIGVKWVDEAR